MLDDEKYMREEREKQKEKKWDFEDWVFTIAGILFGVAMLTLAFGNRIVEYDYYEAYEFMGDFVENIESGQGIDPTDFRQWLPFSWLLFLIAWALCEFKAVIDSLQGKEMEDSLATYLGDALYLTITIALLVIGIVSGTWYASWLAGPIMWVLTIIFLAILKKSDDDVEVGDRKQPISGKAIFLIIFTLGIAIEILTQAWIAFPLAWVIICGLKVINMGCRGNLNESRVFDLLYYFASFALITIGLIWNFWFTSWLALPVVFILSKLYGKITARKHK
ncbi:MAG: hypothetical protein FWE05_11085 [Defluviitaleaceae bacterium]|nr:hypothetical protein [Defluviitaleaceae bacterium]